MQTIDTSPCIDRETAKTLLDLLNPLHGSLDEQTYDEKRHDNFDSVADREFGVNVTAQMERDLTQAVLILERRLRGEQENPAMATLSDHHRTLTNGVGKCSVPMWRAGSPSGFCDAPAYGERPACASYWNAAAGRMMRTDHRYDGYVPGLACEAHGGPPARHFGDPCVHCGTPHDEVAPGPCPANL